MEEHVPKAVPNKVKKILSDAFKKGSLSTIHANMYRAPLSSDEIYDQGNGVENIPMNILPSTIMKKIEVMCITNSCDTSSDNSSSDSARVTFCATKTVSAYRRLLKEKTTMTDDEVESHIESAKTQFVSDIMFLPALDSNTEEKFVFFSLPNSILIKAASSLNPAPKRTFILSDNAFYLLLTKISIHFLRFGEVPTA